MRFPGYKTRQHYLFSTLLLGYPKYSQNKYGGLMEAEIWNIRFDIKMPQAVQLDLKI